MFRCNYKSFPHTYQLDFSHGAFFFFHSFHRAPFIGADIGSICDHYLTNSSSLRRLFWCQTICFYFVVLVEKSKKKKRRWKKCGFILISGCQRGYSSFTHVRLCVCLQSWRRRQISYLYLHRGFCLVQCFLFCRKINQKVTKTRLNNIGTFNLIAFKNVLGSVFW